MKRLLLLLPILFVSPSFADLDIYCLDVGQGDSTLIVSDAGQTLLIDGGSNGKGDAVIVPFLQANGINSLTYTVATHMDSDHIGGLDEVASASDYLPIVAYDNGRSDTTVSYQDYSTAVSTVRQTISVGQVIDLGGGTTATCLCVNGMLPVDQSLPITDDNDSSVGLLVQYKDFDFWVSGDLGGGGLGQADVESEVAPFIGNVDVLHINHHGSSSSSTQTFLQNLMPEITVISVGNNSYGHPTQEVLDRISSIPSVFAIVQTETGSGGTNDKVMVANDNIHIHVLASSCYSVSGGPVGVNIGSQSTEPSGDFDNDQMVSVGDLLYLLKEGASGNPEANLAGEVGLDWQDVFMIGAKWMSEVPDSPCMEPTPVDTETPTPSPTATPTDTETPSPTLTASPSSTVTQTQTITPSPSSTVPPTSSPTITPTKTATRTPTRTSTLIRTPTKTNTPRPQTPRIELYSAIPNPAGPDAGNEKITVINRGSSTVNLSGWLLKDLANHSVGMSGSIGVGQTRTFTPSSAWVNNDGDTLYVVNPDGVVVDTGSYTGDIGDDEVVYF